MHELKPVTKGREKGAMLYLVAEHVAVLKLMLSQMNAFKASESSEEWRNLYQKELLFSLRQQSLVIIYPTWAPSLDVWCI